MKTINKIKEFVIKNQTWISMLIVILVFILYFIISDCQYRDTFDSAGYIKMSKQFKDAGGQFSFANYSNELRGYFFPFLIYIFSCIARVFSIKLKLCLIIMATLFTAYLLSILIPNFICKKKTIQSFFIRIVPAIIFVYFWSDLIFYTLSDIWALGFSVIACILVSHILKKETSYLKLITFSLLTGIMAYASYNTRPIYLFTVIGLALVIIVYCIIDRKRDLLRKGAMILCIVFGFALCGAPQMIVNQKVYNENSIFILNGLMTKQLSWGMTISRYDSVIDEEYVAQHGNKFYSFDANGQNIMTRENIIEFDSVVRYMRAVLEYPFDFVSIYTRHAVNGMFLFNNHNVYITNFKVNVYSVLLNFIVCFLGLFGIIRYLADYMYINTLYSNHTGRN